MQRLGSSGSREVGFRTSRPLLSWQKEMHFVEKVTVGSGGQRRVSNQLQIRGEKEKRSQTLPTPDKNIGGGLGVKRPSISSDK